MPQRHAERARRLLDDRGAGGGHRRTIGADLGVDPPEWRGPRAPRRAARRGDRPRPETPAPQDTAFLRMLDGLPYGASTDGKVIRVIAVGQGDTIASLAARMALRQLREERFVTLNGLDPDQPLKPGTLVKLVVAR